MSRTIKKLVHELPEQYQPIYNYSEFDNNSSRGCNDRVELLKSLIQTLSAEYKRPLRVLDLGCAQGYFCFNSAAWGCELVGVDYSKQNISLCKALAQENPELNCQFERGDVIDKINTLQAGDFDLICAFSVFHHICHARGRQFVKRKLSELSRKCDVFLYESALQTEPMYWAKSLPKRPDKLINDFSFYCKLEMFKTHLSDIARPIYFCSNKFWFLNKKLEAFDQVKYRAHHQSPSLAGCRRYYCSTDKFLKVYYFWGQYVSDQREQIKAEIQFYRKFGTSFGELLPEYISGGINNEFGYVMLNKIDGCLISDLQDKQGKIDIPPKEIIHKLLELFCKLEAEGLYFNDLRTWNLMLTNDNELKLIDVAAIQNKSEDVAWPYNIFVSFILFVYEIYNGCLLRQDLVRQFRTSPVWLNSGTDMWMQKLWSISYKKWSFKLILEVFLADYKDEDSFPIDPLNSYLWMGIVEEFLSRVTGFRDLGKCIRHKDIEISRLRRKCMDRDNKPGRLIGIYKSMKQRFLNFVSTKMLPRGSYRRKTVKHFYKPLARFFKI